VDNAAASGRFFMLKKVSFPQLLSAIAFGYILFCSVHPVKDAVTYIGFLLSIVAIWVNPPGEPRRNRSPGSDNPDW
jgi:hypothetical protein